nr:mediator of RNA polymerase II transcription subunit 31-like isoform X2 [Penaeus vannamei]
MASRGESEDGQRLRFQIELEFVQCLANPNYLLFLAQRGYFKDQTFINYLKYLQYWKEPEYAKYLKYPVPLFLGPFAARKLQEGDCQRSMCQIH